MSEFRVASRYAKSLIDLAQEQGVLEEVHNDMQLFSNTLELSRDLKMLLKNPVIKSDKKQSVLKSIFETKINKLTSSFFSIITRKGRESMLEFIAVEFLNQYNILKGIQIAKITTASELSSELRSEFSQLIERQTGKQVELEESVDPSLIGGFVLRVGDKQIDSSVKSSVRRLKNKFKENPYISKL